jgi:glycosyltransferase involved in cell wall biosynthesis
MRILAIHTGSQLDGSTRNLGFIVETLVRRGHTVDVVNRSKDNESSLYLNRCGATLHYFSRFSLRMNTTTILESSDASLVREAITAVHDVIKWFAGIYITAKYIRQCRPDVVFVTESALPQCVLTSKLMGVPVVCELQAEMIRGRLGLRRTFYMSVVRRADRIFGITSTHIKPFLTHRAGAEKVSVIPNTVERDRGHSVIDIREKYSIPARYKIVSYFGGAIPIKGYRFVLSFIERVIRSRQDVVFVLAGPFHQGFSTKWARGSRKEQPADTEYLLNFASADAISPYIRVVGELADVHALIRTSAVVISSNSFPHFSRTIMEACFNGIPVLAADDEFGREIIKDGESGMLATFGDTEVWLGKLANLLDDPVLTARIAIEARKIYDVSFEREAVSARVISLFEGLYDERCPRESTGPLKQKRHLTNAPPANGEMCEVLLSR